MELLEILQNIVETLGYAGIFAATGLEYACFPISSEILLPFLGYTVALGNRSLWITILISTLAGVTGSLFCYILGRIGGNFLEQTLCRKFHTLQIGMNKAKSIFKKYGKESVFLARMFPIARTYISFPAGIAAMELPLFLLYTGLGAFLWNTILISGGYLLGSHWIEVKQMFQSWKWIPIILFILFLVFLFRKKRKSY